MYKHVYRYSSLYLTGVSCKDTCYLSEFVTKLDVHACAQACTHTSSIVLSMRAISTPQIHLLVYGMHLSRYVAVAVEGRLRTLTGRRLSFALLPLLDSDRPSFFKGLIREGMLRVHPSSVVMEDLYCMYYSITTYIQTVLMYS